MMSKDQQQDPDPREQHATTPRYEWSFFFKAPDRCSKRERKGQKNTQVDNETRTSPLDVMLALRK